MENKRRILLAALLVALLCGFAWWLLRPSEPYYKGKSLSAWLESYGSTNGWNPNDETDEAMRNMGTNAYPTLFKMLRAKDSQTKTKFIELLGRQNLVNINIMASEDKNREAYIAFCGLGPLASNAVPGLIEIYNEKISEESQTWSAASLEEIGPAAKTAIPSLLRELTLTNEGVCWSVGALGAIHSEPELVVPELMKLLWDSNPTVRGNAVIALGKFGTNAKAAIPGLTELLNDPATSRSATNALKQIDPEAAAKAGIK